MAEDCNLDLENYKTLMQESNDEVEKLQKTTLDNEETIEKFKNEISEWKDKTYNLELEMTDLNIKNVNAAKSVLELEELKQQLTTQIRKFLLYSKTLILESQLSWSAANVFQYRSMKNALGNYFILCLCHNFLDFHIFKTI